MIKILNFINKKLHYVVNVEIQNRFKEKKRKKKI